MTEPRDPQLERLRWQCRRGMLEVDLLLKRFLDAGFSSLDQAQKSAFADLLEYPDHVLVEWLMGRQRPSDERLAHVVDCIRDAPAP